MWSLNVVNNPIFKITPAQSGAIPALVIVILSLHHSYANEIKKSIILLKLIHLIQQILCHKEYTIALVKENRFQAHMKILKITTVSSILVPVQFSVSMAMGRKCSVRATWVFKLWKTKRPKQAPSSSDCNIIY